MELKISDTEASIHYKDTPARTVSVKNVLARLHNDLPTGLLTPAVRWSSTDRCTWIVERPPAKILTTYSNANKYDAKDNPGILIEFPMPWQIYVVTLFPNNHSSLYLYVRNAPLQSLEDIVGVYPLPNCSNGMVCLPDNRDKLLQATIAERINATISTLWGSGFNNNVPAWCTSEFVPPESKYDTKGHHMTFSSRYQEEFVQYLDSVSLEEVLTWTWPMSSTLSSRVLIEGPTLTEKQVRTQFLNTVWSSAAI